MNNNKTNKCLPLPLATKRDAPGCGGEAGCGGAGLTFAASNDMLGSWLRQRGKLAVTRREAGVREGGLAK